MKAICPKNPRHKKFITSVHEVHDWIVDETGEFIRDLRCTDISSQPNSDNVWICIKCGAEAKVTNKD